MSVHHVPFPLTAGTEIVVKGVPQPECTRASINLGVGSDFEEDTALHFNPRFDESVVIRNHFSDGWGDEESDGDFPFAHEAPFEVKIVVRDDCYQIYVNGTHFCDFNHRLPKEKVRNVFVEGEIGVTEVYFNDKYSQNRSNTGLHPVPFTLTDGKEIIVTGVPRLDCDRMSINLCAGSDLDEDTALHFNPRFDESVVIRNHFSDGWGEEEAGGDFPFAREAPFEVKIIVRDDCYQIYVNGEYFCDFNHRLPKENVRNVFIMGETSGTEIYFNDSYRYDSGIHPVPFTFSEGKEVKVRGVALPSCDRFSINLCSGADYSTDTALHFNPRFDYSTVVRNHHQGGWGEEETDGGFPFNIEEPFEVKITARETQFQVSVNGEFFCDFNYRLPKEIVRNVYIAGDVAVHDVSFNDSTPNYNPRVPFTTSIRGGLTPGRRIYISGRPKTDPERFNVNLMRGASFDRSDLALHYDVRFNFGECVNTCVRTSRTGGDYGDEERDEDCFPFIPDAPFDIVIDVTPEFYSIAVNGQHHCTFGHRVQPLHMIDHIHIQGDVELSQVRLE